VQKSTNAGGGVAGFLLALGVGGLPSAAAEVALLEEDFFAELPLVVTASRLPQEKTELPASVTVIDREMIEASGAVEIPDLFRLVPGFQVGHFDGSRTAVTYHGVSDEYARRMQVLVDGRSVYMPATGGVEWRDLPLELEDVERIEVTRGPNGVTYGANAFLGVINIITFHPDDVQGTTLSLRTEHPSSEHGAAREKSLVRHADRHGPFSYRLTASYSTDNGFRDHDPDPARQWQDGWRNRVVNFRGEYRYGVNDYLGMQFGLTDGPREAGYLEKSSNPARTTELQRSYQSLSWRRILSTREEFTLRLHRNVSELEDDYLTAPLSEELGVTPEVVEYYFAHPDEPLRINDDLYNERYNLELEHRLPLGASARLVWGAEARCDSVEAAGYLNRASTVTNHLYRLFFNAEYRPAPRWQVNAGAMLEENDITDIPPSPRLALNYRYRPDHTVRASWTRAYRTPAIFEEYGDYVLTFADGAPVDTAFYSDGGIDPERIDSYELALVGSPRNGLSYELKLFRHQMRDLIETPRNRRLNDDYYSHLCEFEPGLCASGQFINGASIDTDGVELELKLRTAPRTFVHLSWSRAESSGTLREFLEADGTVVYYDEPLVPKTTLGALFSHTTPGGWQGSLGLYAVDDLLFLSGDATGGYNTLDLRLARHFRSGGMEGRVALTVQDLSGDYYDFQEEMLREQRIYLALNVQFR